MNYFFSEHESIDGLFIMENAALICGLHPSKISVSDSSIDFAYGDVTRSFALERSDGKITAFTNPDGTRTEVLHNG